MLHKLHTLGVLYQLLQSNTLRLLVRYLFSPEGERFAGVAVEKRQTSGLKAVLEHFTRDQIA